MDRARQLDLAPKPATRRASSKRARASARQVPNLQRLSLVIAGDEPPTEFCIFAAGKVETTKGSFLFDTAAAKSVMTEYAAHGIDLMIDYDHASLAALSLDPAQTGKAAGWFNLEVRNGALWAVNVRWTPGAAEALRAKEWRFMSPAFATEDGPNGLPRICALMNVAITNLPATRRLEPLMAASVTALGDTAMSLEEFMKVCKALGLDMTMSLDDAMAKIKGEKPAEDAKDAPEEGADPAAVGEPVSAGPDPAGPQDQKPKDDKAVAASVIKFMQLSGKATLLEALEEASVWRTSHLTLETERQTLANERLVLEAAERRKGCVDLVTLAGRAPATVWADDSAKAPKAYLSAMPIADFRAMIADAIKANGAKPTPKPAAPLTIVPGTTVQLTASELAACVKSGCTPEAYAALKAQRDSVQTST